MADSRVAAPTPRRRAWPWVVVGLLVTGALVAFVALHGPSASPSHRPACSPDAVPAGTVWSAEWSPAPDKSLVSTECVGVSDGAYAFDRPELKQVFDALGTVNRAADNSTCKGTAVTIGVPLTLTSPNAEGQVRNELEGFVATQAAANADPLCTHPIKLRIGQTGTAQEAASTVASRLVDDGAVALVGMGLSDVATATAVNDIGGRPKGPVPMVADLISAEGFDATGSAIDQPKWSDCDDTDSYKNGIGKGWFYRVSYRNTVQTRTLQTYNAGAPVGFLVKTTLRSDPASCTNVAEYRSQFINPIELKFSPEDPTRTLEQAAYRICTATGHVRVIYGARSLDLATFLYALDQDHENGSCTFDDVTVLAGSDSSRLRAADTDPDRERTRLAALRSPGFRSGLIRLIQTPLADPDLPSLRTSPGYRDLTDQFRSHGFAEADIDDGWAVNAHDALMTVVAALHTVPQDEVPRAVDVNAAIANGFQGDPTDLRHAVPQAIGQPLTFDPAGNRTGTPAVVRLCWLPNDQSPHPRTRTVVVGNGSSGDCG